MRTYAIYVFIGPNYANPDLRLIKLKAHSREEAHEGIKVMLNNSVAWRLHSIQEIMA
jgi:hypothetical protein